MAPRTLKDLDAETEAVLQDVWVCEGCGAENHGENPPDACRVCGHGYFDNLLDLARGE